MIKFSVWSKFGFGSKLVSSIGIYLILALQPFFAVWLIVKTSPAALIYPYLACAMPGVVLLLLIARLRQREVQGMSPERLARNWGMSGAFFAVGTVVAVIYTGVSLGLMDRTNLVGSTAVSAVLGGSIVYAILHHTALDSISARSRREIGQVSPK